MSYSRIASIILALGSLSTLPAQAQVLVDRVFENISLTNPVDFRSPSDGSNRIFIVEQTGRVVVFENDPSVESASVFLEIQEVRFGGERGLLSLAFHPDYASNGRFFVYYTNNANESILAEYTVSSDPNQADPSTARVLLRTSQPFSNHNGGQIGFGPDGMLYLSLGDGGSAGDPLGNGQDRTTLLGSIIRIDVDNTSDDLFYAIPSDNPFSGNSAGYREEIFAYGFRNVWRMSFDAATGQLWAADVGQNRFEEVDTVSSGGNYGWNVREGFECFPSPPCSSAGLTPPVFVYDHGLGRSVTGGYVYRGEDVPELAGRYVFGDFVSGRVWSLSHADPSNAVELFDTALNISTFGLDEAGELYMVDHGGEVYRFVSAGSTDIESAGPDRGFQLEQNFPNPFSDQTSVGLRLDGAGFVHVSVFDILGRRLLRVYEGRLAAGTHAFQIDGGSLPAGVYFLALETEGGTSTRLLMKK